MIAATVNMLLRPGELDLPVLVAVATGAVVVVSVAGFTAGLAHQLCERPTPAVDASHLYLQDAWRRLLPLPTRGYRHVLRYEYVLPHPGHQRRLGRRVGFPGRAWPCPWPLSPYKPVPWSPCSRSEFVGHEVRTSVGVSGTLSSLGAAAASDAAAGRSRRMIDLDSTSPTPPYEQIRSQVAAHVDNGALQPGDRLRPFVASRRTWALPSTRSPAPTALSSQASSRRGGVMAASSPVTR